MPDQRPDKPRPHARAVTVRLRAGPHRPREQPWRRRPVGAPAPGGREPLGRAVRGSRSSGRGCAAPRRPGGRPGPPWRRVRAAHRWCCLRRPGTSAGQRSSCRVRSRRPCAPPRRRRPGAQWWRPGARWCGVRRTARLAVAQLGGERCGRGCSSGCPPGVRAPAVGPRAGRRLRGQSSWRRSVGLDGRAARGRPASGPAAGAGRRTRRLTGPTARVRRPGGLRRAGRQAGHRLPGVLRRVLGVLRLVLVVRRQALVVRRAGAGRPASGAGRPPSGAGRSASEPGRRSGRHGDARRPAPAVRRPGPASCLRFRSSPGHGSSAGGLGRRRARRRARPVRRRHGRCAARPGRLRRA